MRRIAFTIIFGIALCHLLPCCGESGADRVTGPPSESAPQLVAVAGLGTVELIALLAHPNELTRTRAHLELLRYLAVETEAPDYPDRLTLFHKFAPHACRAGQKSQTLHILGLFAAQEDISRVLIKQCLLSPHARVRATALELAHFSDNPVDEVLLAFVPDRATLASYKKALGNLATLEAAERLAALESG